MAAVPLSVCDSRFTAPAGASPRPLRGGGARAGGPVSCTHARAASLLSVLGLRQGPASRTWSHGQSGVRAVVVEPLSSGVSLKRDVCVLERGSVTVLQGKRA